MLVKLKKGFIWLGMGFVVLFAARLGYGYLSVPTVSFPPGAPNQEFQASARNYASEKVDKGAGQLTATDQKYEKIASLNSLTRHFDQDETRVRTLVKDQRGLIQFEQRFGLAGNRRLNLVIGVPPEQFDTAIEKIQVIGTITSIRIDKTDKTNEYKSLNAKKTSLEKTIQGLTALKGRSGQIDQLINLESKILEIENEIQSLGVTLGEFDEENEFCTIRFSLLEETARVSSISLTHRLKVALYWTVQYYAILLASLGSGSLLILAVVTLAEKLKWLPALIDRMDKPN